MTICFIAVEWGTAAVKASLLSGTGEVLDRHSLAVKLQDVSREQILEHLSALRTRWPQASTPILLSGMIGSALGWQDVAQLPCPALLSDLIEAAARTSIGEIPCLILPGLKCRSLFGDPDLLRGEEILAQGWIAQHGPDRETVLVCVPGMHGKWIMIRHGRVESFHTSMTVELLTLLQKHSVVGGQMLAAPQADEVFLQGVDRGASGGGLARLAFGIRARVLQGELAAAQAASYAWGLLIGADVRESLQLYGSQLATPAFATVGNPQTSVLFAAALHHLGAAHVEVLHAETLSAACFAAVGRQVRTGSGDASSDAPHRHSQHG